MAPTQVLRRAGRAFHGGPRHVRCTLDALEKEPAMARRALLAVLAFEALGAFVGGPLLIAGPDGHFMKIPVTDLAGVFPDFLIPGVILTALGALNAAAFFVVLRRMPSAWLWAGLALGGFFIWFVVELA